MFNKVGGDSQARETFDEGRTDRDKKNQGITRKSHDPVTPADNFSIQHMGESDYVRKNSFWRLYQLMVFRKPSFK